MKKFVSVLEFILLCVPAFILFLYYSAVDYKIKHSIKYKNKIDILRQEGILYERPKMGIKPENEYLSK